MKLNKKANLVKLLLSSLLASCNPFTTKDEQDFSKLYVGGFRTIQAAAQEGEKVQLYDHFIYIKFCLKNQEFVDDEGFDYDLEVDLNSSELENLSNQDNCAFYEVGEKFKKLKSFSSYSNIKKFYDDENYMYIFTSIGKYSERNRVVSKKAKIPGSGYAYAFSSISQDLGTLRVKYSAIYSDKLYLFDTITF